MQIAYIIDNQLYSSNISRPVPTELSVCGNGEIEVNLTPGFGGNSCKWYISETDSTPIAVGSSITLTSTQINLFFVSSYDTLRNVESDRSEIALVFGAIDEATIYDTIHVGETYEANGLNLGVQNFPGDQIYTLTLENQNSCDSIIHIYLTVLENVGIDENGMQFSIFPNPATTEVTVRTDFGNLREVQVVDMAGRIIKKSDNINTGNCTININELATGCYFLRIYPHEGTPFIHKLLKK